ncbi:hypothetical protein VTL71DRAFT_670 [Oculimacula yallundae]|uniref:Uncharacterized protein n=1 Tax=Oculimacula yallundae TaxID=86028 RepID=A0ABR4D0Q4_9HELO
MLDDHAKAGSDIKMAISASRKVSKVLDSDDEILATRSRIEESHAARKRNHRSCKASEIDDNARRRADRHLKDGLDIKMANTYTAASRKVSKVMDSDDDVLATKSRIEEFHATRKYSSGEDSQIDDNTRERADRLFFKEMQILTKQRNQEDEKRKARRDIRYDREDRKLWRQILKDVMLRKRKGSVRPDAAYTEKNKRIHRATRKVKSEKEKSEQDFKRSKYYIPIKRIPKSAGSGGDCAAQIAADEEYARELEQATGKARRTRHRCDIVRGKDTHTVRPRRSSAAAISYAENSETDDDSDDALSSLLSNPPSDEQPSSTSTATSSALKKKSHDSEHDVILASDQDAPCELIDVEEESLLLSESGPGFHNDWTVLDGFSTRLATQTAKERKQNEAERGTGLGNSTEAGSGWQEMRVSQVVPMSKGYPISPIKGSTKASSALTTSKATTSSQFHIKEERPSTTSQFQSRGKRRQNSSSPSERSQKRQRTEKYFTSDEIESEIKSESASESQSSERSDSPTKEQDTMTSIERWEICRKSEEQDRKEAKMRAKAQRDRWIAKLPSIDSSRGSGC